MSYFYIGVGGTGAKLLQTLIHLSAAGMLPEPGRPLSALLVDSDLANGNISDCKEIFDAYASCHALKVGDTDLFKPAIALSGPWTPVTDPEAVKLGDIFNYDHKKVNQHVDADLMDLLFEGEEIGEPVKEGFRGRPAIGSVILANTIDFKRPAPDNLWYKLRQDLDKANGASIPILLSGSIFGGTGAAGVPTILKMLDNELMGTPVAGNPPPSTGGSGTHAIAAPQARFQLGLTLFLPYFTYAKVIENGVEVMQADPNGFNGAAAEALKYYYEHEFLSVCTSIYAIGERKKALMPVPAVGAGAQRNEPHYVELVAGLGVLRFFSKTPKADEKHTLSLVARKEENTLTWEDLPAFDGIHGQQLKKLKRMILFAVSFRYFFYPEIAKASSLEKSHIGWINTQLLNKGVNLGDAKTELGKVNTYVEHFLTWLLRISTPRIDHFIPGLVDITVFADPTSDGWQLKPSTTQIDKLLPNLFRNSQVKPGYRDVWNGADKKVTDSGVVGSGRLVRAIYDSCSNFKF